jgi:2-dehydro-3-deoxyphosphooctonate aldolase (KDO 8-P synthase)
MAQQSILKIGPVVCGNEAPLMLIAGPCSIESRDHAIDMASALVEICADLEIGFIPY